MGNYAEPCRMLPPGFEPGIAVPKTAVISVSPREPRTNTMRILRIYIFSEQYASAFALGIPMHYNVPYEDG